MRFAVVALALSFAAPAADAKYTRECGQRFAEIQKTSKKARTKQSTLESYAALRRLSALEQRAVATYRQKFGIQHPFHEGEEGSFFEVFTQSLLQRRTNKALGYRIAVSMGGDEDTVTYYYTPRGKLLFWRWSNQSPETGWPCEGY